MSEQNDAGQVGAPNADQSDPNHGKDTPAYANVQGETREFGGGQPGVMGDGTEEQNLGQEGDPSARITEEEVQAAYNDPSGAAEDGAEPGVR